MIGLKTKLLTVDERVYRKMHAVKNVYVCRIRFENNRDIDDEHFSIIKCSCQPSIFIYIQIDWLNPTIGVIDWRNPS